MKFKISLAIVMIMLFFLTTALPSFSSGENWFTDFEKASKIAKEKNLPILVDFSGSDWCGWCVKLDKEVFSQPEFKKYAKDNLVLVMADFPRKTPQSDEIKAQNKALAQKYGIRGFPTVILLNSDGEKINKTGYQAGGPAKYVEHIKSLLVPKKKVVGHGSGLWIKDYKEVQKLAKEKNLPILINFSGSDWCYWCKKIDSEIFSKKEFEAYAKENLILYVADFPSSIVQSAELKAQNNKLKEKYGITGFPTIMLLNSKEELIARTGYKAGGPEVYIKHLQSLIKK